MLGIHDQGLSAVPALSLRPWRRAHIALTVVHNFHIRRPNRTTPADRFFGTQHDNLFSRLLDRMPQLARTAAARSKRPDKVSKEAAA